MKRYSAFESVWKEARAASKDRLVHSSFLRESGAESLEIGKRLLADLNYLGDMQQSKFGGKASRQALEREFLSHARGAGQSSRKLFASTLRSVRHFKSSGAIDDVFDVWKSSLAKSGELTLAETWKGVSGNLKLADLLRVHGFSPELEKQVSDSLEQLNAVMSDRDGSLHIGVPTQHREMEILNRNLGGQDRNVLDLLTKNRFDAVTEMFEQPDRLFADVVMHSGKAGDDGPVKLDLLDGVLAGSVLSVRELDRQVREVEEVGLPAFRGEVTGGLLAALILLIIGAVLITTGCILWAVCISDSSLSPDMDEPICEAAAIILCLGFAVMLASILVVGGVAAGAGMVGLSLLAWGGAAIMGTPGLALAISYAAEARGGELESD